MPLNKDEKYFETMFQQLDLPFYYDNLVTMSKRWSGYKFVCKNLFQTIQCKHYHWFLVLLDTFLWLKGFNPNELFQISRDCATENPHCKQYF